MLFIPRNEAVQLLSTFDGEQSIKYDRMSNEELYEELLIAGVLVETENATITGHEGGM